MKAARIQALKDLIKIVKQLKQEDIKGIDVEEKPNLSPEHEAQESPEVEKAEHELVDVELGEPMGEVSSDEKAEQEETNPEEELSSTQDNLNKEEEEVVSPFTSDKERMNKNKYKGGQYKAIMAGVIAKSEGKNKRK